MGRMWIRSVLTAAFLTGTFAFPQTPTELVPVYQNDGHSNIAVRGQKTNGIGGKYKLQDTEQFVWLSPPESKQNLALTLDVFTKADEYVLDLNKFKDELREFTCSKPEHLTLHFKHNASYAQALEAWSWVKGNNSRAFILVEDHPACKTSDDDRQRRPWLVTDLHKAGNMSIAMDATKKKWKEVLHTYEMKFGQGSRSSSPPSSSTSSHSSSSPTPSPLSMPSDLDTRQLDWTNSFSIPLSSTFPRFMLNDTYKNVGIDIICEECGTTGSLEVSGHIAADIINGLTKLEITITGKAITANVELGMQLTAAETAPWLQPYEKHFTIAKIPLGDLGIVIPNLLTIGPNLQINGGITAGKIQGAAMFKSGVKASVQDPSTVSLDLLSKKKLSATGWTPKFDWNPLSTSESLNLTAELYTEIATAISFMVLEEDGFNADVSLRVPDLNVNAAGVYNSKGVCKGSNKPIGVTLDMNIGANLLINEYVEENGDEVQSLDIPLFNVPKVITIPEECAGFDLGGIVSDPPSLQKPSATAAIASLPSSSSAAANPSTAPSTETIDDTYTPTPEEQDYWDHESADAGSGKSKLRPKRGIADRQAAPHELVSRISKGPRPYYLACDNLRPQGEPIYSWSYPGPLEALLGTPKSAGKTPPNCPLVEILVGNRAPFDPANWKVAIDPSPTRTSLPSPTNSWASEHIYERNWIPDYIDHLYTKYFENTPVPSQAAKICRGAVSPFHAGASRVTTDTKDNTKAIDYLQGLMQSLGTDDNWWETMVIFPQPQNLQKFSMFAGQNLDAGITTNGAWSFNTRVMRIGRIVALCDYMSQTEILNRLTATIRKIQSILKLMDTDPDVNKLTPAALQGNYSAEHLDWFQPMFEGGFANARSRLQAHARSVLSSYGTTAVTLPANANIVTALRALSTGNSQYCKTPSYNVKTALSSSGP